MTVRPGFVYDLPWTFDAESYTGGTLADSLLSEIEDWQDRVSEAEDQLQGR